MTNVSSDIFVPSIVPTYVNASLRQDQEGEPCPRAARFQLWPEFHPGHQGIVVDGKLHLCLHVQVVGTNHQSEVCPPAVFEEDIYLQGILEVADVPQLASIPMLLDIPSGNNVEVLSRIAAVLSGAARLHIEGNSQTGDMVLTVWVGNLSVSHVMECVESEAGRVFAIQ